MGTTADKLNKLLETKTAIKEALVAKGVSVAETDTFSSYADKIASIETGGGGSSMEYWKIPNVLPTEDDLAEAIFRLSALVKSVITSFGVFIVSPYYSQLWGMSIESISAFAIDMNLRVMVNGESMTVGELLTHFLGADLAANGCVQITEEEFYEV